MQMNCVTYVVCMDLFYNDKVLFCTLHIFINMKNITINSHFCYAWILFRYSTQEPEKKIFLLLSAHKKEIDVKCFYMKWSKWARGKNYFHEYENVFLFNYWNIIVELRTRCRTWALIYHHFLWGFVSIFSFSFSFFDFFTCYISAIILKF